MHHTRLQISIFLLKYLSLVQKIQFFKHKKVPSCFRQNSANKIAFSIKTAVTSPNVDDFPYQPVLGVFINRSVALGNHASLLPDSHYSSLFWPTESYLGSASSCSVILGFVAGFYPFNLLQWSLKFKKRLFFLFESCYV